MVSVIIPVYKAEKYIRKCLESLLEQTYRDIEILVVDDDSPDNSLEIVRELAERDERIRAFHKENLGVSAARNYGLERAGGEYVTFVDADDYVTRDYVEYLLGLVQKENADFGMSQNAYVSKGQRQVEPDVTFSMQSTQAVAFLLSPRVIVGCWNKIYKREFLIRNGLWFSTELFYGEGLQFIVNAAERSNQVAVGSRRVYYYRRNNEASATSKFDVEKLRNGEKSLLVILEQTDTKDKEIMEAWLLHHATFCLGATIKILAAHGKKEFQSDYNHFQKGLRDKYWRVMRQRKVSFYRKLMLTGGMIWPWLVMKLDQIRRKRLAENSI